MKKLKFWKRIGLLVIVMLMLTIFGQFYFLYSGPFDAAVFEYGKQFRNSRPEKIELCFTCRKRVSFGSGFRRFRFSIKVTETNRVKYFQVIDTFNTDSKKHEVIFAQE